MSGGLDIERGAQPPLGPVAQIKVATSSNSSFLARYRLPFEASDHGQLRLEVMLQLPTMISIQGVVDVEGMDSSTHNRALEFSAAAGEWIDLGVWAIGQTAPRLTITGLCKPAHPRNELELCLRWEFLHTQQRSRPAEYVD